MRAQPHKAEVHGACEPGTHECRASTSLEHLQTSLIAYGLLKDATQDAWLSQAGADECKTNFDFHEIQCPINEIYNVKKELEKEINNFISTEIEWRSLNRVEISKDKHENLINFLETLEEDDDVQNIYSNAEFAK